MNTSNASKLLTITCVALSTHIPACTLTADATREKVRSYASLADARGWTAAHHASEACLPTVIAAQVSV